MSQRHQRSEQVLLNINIIRLTLYTIFFIISVVLYLSHESKPVWLLSLIVIAISLIWTLFHKKIFTTITTRPALYSFIVIDSVLISLLVYISGGIFSPLYFLYLFPIIITANFLKRRDTVIVASLTFILFGILADLIFLRVIPPFNSDETAIPIGGFIYNLAMAFFSFLIVAVLSSYYFEHIRLAKKELANAVANLKDLLELNSTLLDQIEDGFFTADGNCQIVSNNKKAQALLKLPESKRMAQNLIQQAVKRLAHDENYAYFEYDLPDKNLGVSVNRLQNVYSFAEFYIFVVHDLTEKRVIEQELRKKEHLALIGEISAGMAHELRNPLASISGSVQYLQKRLQLDDDTQNLMQIIVTETKRLSKSIEDFLDFARDNPLRKTTFNLTELVDEVVQLVQIAQRDGVHIRKDYPQSAFWIDADYEKMRQLLQNLLSNGLKAIEKSGNLTVSLTSGNGKTRLAVKDSGIGMDADVLKEIFTPFFSKFSKGIGLGMAIVKKIVDEHRYEIEINSERGKGTEVVVWI